MPAGRSTVGGALAGIFALSLALVSGPAQSAEPIKIRLAYVVPVANWAPILFAKPGLAKHLGKSYTFEDEHFQGTPPMITAMAANELEIGDLAYSSFALAVENAGMSDLRIIADEFQDGVPGYFTDQFLVRKDSPIKTVTDLKGKVLATNAVGSAVDMAMRAMLRKNHLDDRKDMTIVEAAFPNMLAMLTQDKVDLFPGVLPFAVAPNVLQATRVLFTQEQAVGRTQMIVWAARAGFLAKNRAAMVDFMEDALRAERWYLDPANHQEAVEIAAKISKQPADRYEGWLFTKKDYYRDPNGKPDLEALQANIKLQKDLGFLKTDLEIKKYADLSLVEEAAKRLK